jgi:death-on-curing protein
VSVLYVDLLDYLAIAAELTGLDTPTLQRVTKIELAESALHAPAAGFGDIEFYPDFIDKATVLLVRLAKNHPLPDGNKRAAWVSLRLFVEINDWTWRTTPTVDEAEKVVLASQPGLGARATLPETGGTPVLLVDPRGTSAAGNAETVGSWRSLPVRRGRPCGRSGWPTAGSRT